MAHPSFKNGKRKPTPSLWSRFCHFFALGRLPKDVFYDVKRHNLGGGIGLTIVSALFGLLLAIAHAIRYPSGAGVGSAAFRSWIIALCASIFLFLTMAGLFAYLLFLKRKNPPDGLKWIVSMDLIPLILMLCGPGLTLIELKENGDGHCLILFAITAVAAFDVISLNPVYSLVLLGGVSASLYPYALRLDAPADAFLWSMDFWIFVLMAYALSVIRHTSACHAAEERVRIREMNDRLHLQSITDGLTGLKNRVGLHEDLEKITRQEGFMAILDIDDFKHYNDLHGHLVGDELLRLFARTLSKEFPGDTQYRFGGDEFVAFIPRSAGENPQVYLDRVNADLANVEIRGKKMSLTCEMGVAYVLSENVSDYWDALQKADDALIASKNDRNHRRFEKRERETAMSRLRKQLDQSEPNGKADDKR